MVELLAVILTLLSGLIAFVYLLKYVNKNQQDFPHKLPPGSMGWPFSGETLGFLKSHKSNSLGSFLKEHCSRYGKVFKSHLFGSPTIVSCDFEFNMYILQNEGELFPVDYPKVMHNILGKFSVLLSKGDLHRKLRSTIISFVSATKYETKFLHSMEILVLSTINSWDPNSKQVAFYKEAKRARKRLAAIIKNIILGRQKSSNARPVQGGDLLNMILSKQNLSVEEMVSIVLDLLFGGYETTAKLLSLIVYFLGGASNALQRLKEEHQEIRKRKKEGEPLNWDDYKQMEFTQKVIYEAMRCGNVVKFLHRKAVQDVKFKDYVIPAGWKVLPVLSAGHLDPTLFENPLEFDPFRWNDNSIRKKVAPFGGGPRLCPGADLAKVETAFFLHHFVLNYRYFTHCTTHLHILTCMHRLW
uniref:Cytochrome P450 n=1 Tax=Phaseolus vulgaris TaxID=3885 RepID=V7B7M4_PHAVU|nr:hypothetical protein PHAVU_008G147500g [Phaseolus vulgaris]ESW12853.1 hypothetical protein PHAVU_008G147500g [Phaseolus vulgaris]